MCALLAISASLLLAEPGEGQSPGGCVSYPGNPVVVADTSHLWEAKGVASPSVIFDGSNFSMLYSGLDLNYTSSIGLATSTDGVKWAQRAEPVLEVGSNGTWDSQAVYFPSVVWNGTEYLMYFTGYNQTTIGIGVAFSKDLIHWQEYSGNPVLSPGPGAYDSVSVTSHTVMFDPPFYKMWYSGRYPVNYTHSIGYAISTDGLHWTKYAENPVITRSTNNDSYMFGPWGPTVLKVGSEYFAAYETDGRVSSATSPDGEHWTASAVPFLRTPDLSDATGYAIENPWMLLKNSTAYIWYTETFFAGTEPTAIGFGFCALGQMVRTTTLTSVSVATLETTAVTQVSVVETLTQTSTTTEQGPLAVLSLYQAATAVLAVLSLAALAVAVSRRRRVV